jgi:hypothetical protein
MIVADAVPFGIETIATAEGPIPVVRRGPDTAPVLLLQPLFEEMNRCRHFLADLGRALGALGIATLLPDLPGEGDSPVALGPDGAAHWDRAAAALAGEHAVGIVAMRAGCLVATGTAHPRFHIAPVGSGHAQLRELMRAQAFADLEATGARIDPASYVDWLERGTTVRLAGHAVTPALYRSLVDRVPPAAEVIDFEGPPIWRQAEPTRVVAEAERIAALVAARLRR